MKASLPQRSTSHFEPNPRLYTAAQARKAVSPPASVEFIPREPIQQEMGLSWQWITLKFLPSELTPFPFFHRQGRDDPGRHADVGATSPGTPVFGSSPCRLA